MNEKKQFRSDYDPKNKVGTFELGDSKNVRVNISYDEYSQISREMAIEALINDPRNNENYKVALGGYSSSELLDKESKSKSAGYSGTNLVGMNLSDVTEQKDTEKRKQ